MSRLIVKNLPKNITEDKIKETFSQNGTITDIQLKYTSEGKFRQFGFIGFQNEESADQAVKALNKTFLNTNRITVEKCALLGDESKPKAWSKYASDSTAYKKKNKVDNVEINNTKKKESKKKKKQKNDEAEELLEKYKDDPVFEEFLQVHKSSELEKLHRISAKTTDKEFLPNNTKDDSVKDKTGTATDNKDDDLVENESEDNNLAKQPISDLEYMKKLINKGVSKNDETIRKPRQKMEKKVREKVELLTLKLKDLPYNCKKRDIKDFFKPFSPFSIRIPRKIHGIAFVGFKTEKAFKKGLLKDKSFIKGKQILVMKYTNISNNDDEKNNSDNLNSDTRKLKWKNQEEALKNEEDIAESGKIFMRNLAYTATEDDIEKLFSKFGPLTEVNLPIDSTTKTIKGFGVVTFLMPEHAVKAYSELDGSILHGRMLHLLPGKSKDNENEDNLEESTNFKQKKAAKQKSQAGSSHNWNSLFLGHDAVAEVIADTYGTSKEAVVGPEGQGSAAVRLALGETQIVAQTRKYLEEKGVVLDVFNNAATKRSKTVLLIKNLPSKTEISEIRQIFEKHGDLGRVILPPSGITAIVEFLDPSEARKAFTKLAYSKFKSAPLYLEWAPESTLLESSNIPKKTDNNADENNTEQKDTSPKKDVVNENAIENEEIEEDEEPEPDTTLFVKNLNFQTSDQSLRKHFEGCGKIHYATVATKKDKNNPGNTLSMGYGFVRFMLKNSADKALKTLQQSVLDGKSLELKRSERTLQDDVKVNKKPTKLSKQTGSKILVRNVPFQANRKEIFELFSTFGEIKALRLPKKIAAGADSHRGFAFVDYVTPSDAKAAFEALSQSTHLYGRRLVLEWASKEESVEELRKRTADHFTANEEVKSKKSVFDME